MQVNGKIPSRNHSQWMADINRVDALTPGESYWYAMHHIQTPIRAHNEMIYWLQRLYGENQNKPFYIIKSDCGNHITIPLITFHQAEI